MKLICVCQHCRHSDTDKATLEFNFAEGKVYFVCSECKKTSTIDLNPKTNPLPRMRVR